MSFVWKVLELTVKGLILACGTGVESALAWLFGGGSPANMPKALRPQADSVGRNGKSEHKRRDEVSLQTAQTAPLVAVCGQIQALSSGYTEYFAENVKYPDIYTEPQS